MSRAFVKEFDEAGEELPERLISPHRNFVTDRGLALIEAEIAQLRATIEQADDSTDRGTLARASHDLKYWLARRASAEVVRPEAIDGTVRFGVQVTLLRDDGRRQTYRLVGEDEADPAEGLISYVSPLARAVIGQRVGDRVLAGTGEAEIIAVS
jgi:transcription elongation GreA/GreB family factor